MLGYDHIIIGFRKWLKRAILSIAYVFYIPKSSANLISLAKLNDVGFYWDNKTWNLYDNKKKNQIVGYIEQMV